MLVSLSKSVTFHYIGFMCAMGSTVIFVVQTIFSKKLFQNARIAASVKSPTENDRDFGVVHLDKLNLLFYSAFLAFLFMLPMWIYSEGLSLIRDPSLLPSTHVQLLFLLNGIGCFSQNLFAFTVLSIVSPVTYSIASLIKRIFIISASIIWFRDSVTVQMGFGIALTFFGLYLYERARLDVQRCEERLSDEDVELPTVNLGNFRKGKGIN
jgi:drug/metabolite transporter (DMT)-like permease